MLNLVKVKQSFIRLCKDNNVGEEIMLSQVGRPCVLTMSLSYKGNKHDFVVPLRSNISPNTPRNQYFALPNNKATKSQHHHGIHYIKIMPIDGIYLDKFRIENDAYFTLLQSIINNNETVIIEACQNYLNEYAQGKKHPMTPDIDGILKLL